MANRQFPTVEGGSPPDAGVSGGHAGKTSFGQFIVIARQKRELRKRRLKRTQGPSHLLYGIQHGTVKTQLEMIRRRRPEIGKWVFSPLHIFRGQRARAGPNVTALKAFISWEKRWNNG